MARINNEREGCPQLDAVEMIDRSGRWDIMKTKFKQDLMQADPREFPYSLGENFFTMGDICSSDSVQEDERS